MNSSEIKTRFNFESNFHIARLKQRCAIFSEKLTVIAVKLISAESWKVEELERQFRSLIFVMLRAVVKLFKS